MRQFWIDLGGAFCLLGMAAVAAVIVLPGKRLPVLPPSAGTRWEPGCNDALLATTFALKRAPQFELTDSQSARINEVIDEVRRGYGGTLVVTPRDAVLDSGEFLAAYLRAFAVAEGIGANNYEFSTILNRLAAAPDVLSDARLDWDVWRAFLAFENVTDGTNQYRVRDMINSVSGASDLLWAYLDVNAESIRSDKHRLAWWIAQLTRDLRSPGGRPMRNWFLLQLVASTDSLTEKLIAVREPQRDSESDGFFRMISSSPYHPFLTDRLHSVPTDQGGEFTMENVPAFRDAIREIARSEGLRYVVWGIASEQMPPTRV